MIKELLQNTLLKDVMIKKVVTVDHNDEFHVVWEKMATFGIRHLPVVDDAGGVVGLISQRHLYKIHSPRHLEDGSWYYDKEMLNGFILKNVMFKEPFTLKPTNTLEDAMKPMVESQLGCIPIVDDYRTPLGIVTRVDIIKFFLNHA
jgi:acetoin utilization protein AcuB